MNVLKGDVVATNMDDELLIVDSVDNDDNTYDVLVSTMSNAGKVLDFYHEYDLDTVITVYRAVV